MSTKRPAATPLLARSRPFTGTTASAVNDSPTVQSARRKLHYSQLPVRCAVKKASAPQLVNSLKKFPVMLGPKPDQQPGSSSGRKKSASMIDLSAGRRRGSGDFEPAEVRQATGSASARLNGARSRPIEETLEGCSPMRWPSALRKDEAGQRSSQAASLVCRVLAVNAWRRSRQDAVELRAALADAIQEVERLQLQIFLLRNLLDKENARVASLVGELHQAKAEKDELAGQRDRMKIEKEAAEAEARKEHEIVEEQAVTVENLRNELRTARDQVDTLDKQIAKSRDKLLTLREDRKTLLDKLVAKEALAEEASARASKAELSLEETQVQLATQLGIAGSLQEEVQLRLKQIKERDQQKARLERENARLDERLRSNEEAERARAEYLASQLVDRDAMLRRLEDECKAHVLELKELQELVLRQSQERSWSSRVLQLAGSFVRAPNVILRTLSFFSSSMNSISLESALFTPFK